MNGRSAFSATLNPSRNVTSSPGTNSNSPPSADATQATLAHIEQVRLLILGMEQRLQVREDKLSVNVEKAEKEAGRFEEMRREVLTS